MSDAIFARAAQRLDAEYDGGTSDKDDESDDVDDSPTKLETTSSRKIKLAAKPGKKGKDDLCKKQKTGRASSVARKHSSGTSNEEKAIQELKLKEKEKEKGKESLQKQPRSDEDSVDEEIARLTASLSKKNRPLADESQKTISALLEQTRRTERGLRYAASADVSACDETQAESERENRAGSLMVVENSAPHVQQAQDAPAQSEDKCVISILRPGEKIRKFKIFMHQQMSKVFTAYCEKYELDPAALRFIFDGHPVSWDVTPQQLDMEADEENLIETSLIEIQS